jgi:hypothetical protein
VFALAPRCRMSRSVNHRSIRPGRSLVVLMTVSPNACPAAVQRGSITPAWQTGIPAGESDESSIEVITVLDPRHPLYGRSFQVIRRSTHRGGNFPPSYEVEYCNGSTLLIPISVTEWHSSENTMTKLSIDALQDLISVIECFDSHEYKTDRSLGDIATGTTTSDRRRRCRGLGGGVA